VSVMNRMLHRHDAPLYAFVSSQLSSQQAQYNTLLGFLYSSDAWLHLAEVKYKALLMLSTHLLHFRGHSSCVPVQ